MFGHIDYATETPSREKAVGHLQKLIDNQQYSTEALAYRLQIPAEKVKEIAQGLRQPSFITAYEIIAL